MIKKYYKLTGKDINYIIKKKNIIFGEVFSIFKIPQYPNRLYNQFSIQIPTKLSKRSNKRNQLKRIFFDFVKENDLINLAYNNKFYKYFVITNKNNLSILQQTIELKDKKNIKLKLNNHLYQIFNKLILPKGPTKSD